MIKHIVIWCLKEENKTKNSKAIKEKLEGLKKIIPELKYISVNSNIYNKYTNCDLILECEFENMDELEIYQTHTKHIEIVDFIKSVATQRYCIEYEF
jgi:hypothetical protein